MILKKSLQDLALLGGPPVFPQVLHVGRPYIGTRERFLDLATDIFDTGWFTNDGPLVRRFEKDLADYLGAQHCLAIANATLGLQLVAKAFGLTGDVIVPSFTFAATPSSLAWLGLDL